MTRHVNQKPCSYLVVHLLGTGSFADMHLAEHTYPKTQVALQVLPLQLPEFAAKDFLAEALDMIHLFHPQIMRLLYAGIVLPLQPLDCLPSQRCSTCWLHGTRMYL